jgi:hypothetical protein
MMVAAALMDTGHQDPREAPLFLSQHYPTANGRPAPPPASASRDEVIMLEFLAAYYRLNCEYARLLAIRCSASSLAREQKEREQLQAVERALTSRDHLEDLYAPCGVIAEPVVQEGFTLDVRFTFGAAGRGKARGGENLLIEAFLPINLPPGFDLDDVPIRIHVTRDR